MSPASRGRKRKPVAPPEASLTGFFKQVLRDFVGYGPDADPLQVELAASELAGECWMAGQDGPSGAGSGSDGASSEEIGLELIDFAARKPGPAAAALLAGLRAIAPERAEREAAADALTAMVARGLPEPEWAAALDRIEVGECWRSGDVYGDAASVLCFFERDGEPHGLLGLIDFGELGGWLREVVVVERPAEVLAEMRAGADELVTVAPISGGRARQLLDDAFAGTGMLAEPEVSEDFVRFRALAMARCRTLPDPEPFPAARVTTKRWRADALAEFLAATPELAGEDGAEDWARRLIDYGCEHDPHTPLRVGPEKLAGFLEQVLTEEDALAPALPVVLRAWAEWAARRQELPEAAVTTLLGDIDEYLTGLSGGGAPEGLDAYLTDLTDTDLEEAGPDSDDETVLAAILQRRLFALPSRETEIGDEHLELDPGDPEQRRLLVIGAHPELHAALAEQTLDAELGLRLTVETELVEQLWANDPPEVWQAATRLREAGMLRPEILTVLGGVLAEQLSRDSDNPDAPDELVFDPDAYAERLRGVGVPG